MKPCDDQCACGIARADCDYHAPMAGSVILPSTFTYAFVMVDGTWLPIGPFTALKMKLSRPIDGKFLTSDGYIHTFQDGKLINEEPA